jgi:hypothetical protein
MSRATVSIEIDGEVSDLGSAIWEWYPGRRIREVHRTRARGRREEPRPALA